MPHYKFDKFSIAVSGSGRFFGMFFTDCLNHFPNVTLYDRSERVVQFAQREVALAKTELASAQLRRLARGIERNRANPPKMDVTVTFQPFGDTERVAIEGKVAKTVLNLQWPQSGGFDAVAKLMSQILRAIESIQ